MYNLGATAQFPIPEPPAVCSLAWRPKPDQTDHAAQTGMADGQKHRHRRRNGQLPPGGRAARDHTPVTVWVSGTAGTARHPQSQDMSEGDEAITASDHRTSHKMQASRS